MGNGINRVFRGAKPVVYTLYILGNGILTAYAAAMSVRAFPETGIYPWLPLALLAVGTWVGNKGGGATARFGGTLGFFVLVPLVVVLIFGAQAVELDNLQLELDVSSIYPLLGVGLLPLAGLWFSRQEKRGGRGWIFALMAVAVACSVVVTGTLGVDLAQSVAEPFYKMTKSISIFGVMERFEGLVAAVLLLGFGCLLAYLSAIGGKMWECAWNKGATVVPNLVVALCFFWWLEELPEWLPLVLVGVLWVVLPVFAYLVYGSMAKKGK